MFLAFPFFAAVLTKYNQELAKARRFINDLEFSLESERSRLRAISEENSKATKERERILDKLRETEEVRSLAF